MGAKSAIPVKHGGTGGGDTAEYDGCLVEEIHYGAVYTSGARSENDVAPPEDFLCLLGTVGGYAEPMGANVVLVEVDRAERERPRQFFDHGGLVPDKGNFRFPEMSPYKGGKRPAPWRPCKPLPP